MADEMRWTDEEIQRFWNYESQFDENYYTFRHGRRMFREFQSVIMKNKQQRILDYGCGKGFFLEILCGEGLRADGFDYSNDSRDAVNERCGKLETFGNCYERPQDIPNGTYSIITLFEVVEHLYDEQLADVLGTVVEKLAPGGKCLITTPNEEDLTKSLIVNPSTGEVFHRWQHVRSWSASRLRDTLQSHGLEVERIAATDLKRGYYADRLGVLPLLRRMLRKKNPNLICVASRPRVLV